MAATLYRLDFKNGRSYIGVTVVPINQRLNKHRWSARHGGTYPVYDAWRAFGEPSMVVLAIVEERDMLDLEQRAINSYGTTFPAGYNAAGTEEHGWKSGASQRGRRFSQAHKDKLAAAKRGTKVSADVRAKMSASQNERRRREGCKVKADRRVDEQT